MAPRSPTTLAGRSTSREEFADSGSDELLVEWSIDGASWTRADRATGSPIEVDTDFALRSGVIADPTAASPAFQIRFLADSGPGSFAVQLFDLDAISVGCAR